MMRLRLHAVTREWVERREALLREEEDALIREARDRTTGEDRVFLDAVVEMRARNARGERAS